ncbi:MAG: hypothetical protein ACERKZ_08945 [Lachnotalea sp.]
MTVEAAMVLPIFIFAICFMMYFTEVVRVQAEIGNEIYKQGKSLSVYTYVYKQGQNNEIINSGQLENIVTWGLSNLYVSNQITEELGEDYKQNNNIDNGISFLMSSYMRENDLIDIIATYKISIPCNFFHLGKIPVLQRCRMRGWTGYQISENEEDAEEIVYITQTGTVYHKSSSCTHINLSISQVNINDIKNLRNSGGGKYYECEICGDETNNGSVYITNTGDRYHNSRECSGLKRGVIAIPISEVGTRGPCSRCGN